MDVVYLVKPTRENNIELRYSLRSLKNIKHDKVWIVGKSPKRVKDNVFKINVGDDGEKFDNVINKLKLVCDNDEISKDFIFMHDDIFILKPLEKLEYYHRGGFDNQLKAIKKKFGENEYWWSLNRVREKFPDGLNYDLHIPIVINREKMRKIFEIYPSKSGSKRSLYCNHYKVGGKEYPNGDCKVYEGKKIDLEQDFLSADDRIGTSKEFLEVLESLFPSRGQYELLDFYQFAMKKVKVKILKTLYPYNVDEVAELRFEVAKMREGKGYLEIIDEEIVKLKAEEKKRKAEEKKSKATKTKENKSIAGKKNVENK